MKQLIYENKNLSKIETEIEKVIDINDKHYLVLKENIFYPQGGGQKGDIGIIKAEDKEYPILTSIKNPDNPLEVLIQIPEHHLKENTEVTAIRDEEFRTKQMRLHSALHLLHYVIEDLLGITLEYPSISMIEKDGTALNRYETDFINEDVVKDAFEKLKEEIALNKKMITYPDLEKEGYRYWEYEGYVIPCGGIHVDYASEIGNLSYEYHTKKNHKTIKLILL